MSDLTGTRTGIQIALSSVKKDSAGFDDLDDFFNAEGKMHI